MIAFYHTTLVAFPLAGRTAYRPAFAVAVDALGGHWKPCWQDSATAPSHALVVVNDRRDPSFAHVAAVHDAALAQALRRFDTLSAARAVFPDLVDQEVGGEHAE